MTSKNLFKDLKGKVNYQCPVCKTSLSRKDKIKQLINLPKYPITEFYRKRNEKLIKESLKDQKVMFCKNCDHMFLKNILDVGKIYLVFVSRESLERIYKDSKIRILKKDYILAGATTN